MSDAYRFFLNPGRVVIGDPTWIVPAIAIAVFGVALSLWLNRHRLSANGLGTALRVVGWLLLVFCLVNPLWSSSRPRRGANVLAVVADVSRSQRVATGAHQTRAEQIAELLETGERREPNGWLNRIDQDFELRRYLVTDRLQQVDQYGDVSFDGVASGLQTALEQLKQRFEGQPLAGIILISDGNATDLRGTLAELKGIAPVYPLMLHDDADRPDVTVDSVISSQTAFDDAPVTLMVQPGVAGAEKYQVRVTLENESGEVLESQTRPAGDDSPLRFRHRPVENGTVFYTVKTALVDESGQESEDEITLENNRRMIAVDRGSQPRRILYVSGRPNWEFKFLRRAVETDPQIQLVGLIRIAKKEAKFDFRGREGERSNSLFRGFDREEQELVEEYNEPVLVRIGTKDEAELLGGFPEKADELFQYDAIILDDIEAGFFLADQLKLIYDFVSRRGGGLLMLGGQESFRRGEYDRTPVGEMLPVDLSRSVASPGGSVRLSLTRDGWLQPWVRLRADEAAETERLDAMPGFLTLNTTSFVRPGAVVMAEVTDSSDNRWPALVVQRFGKGKTAALCVGDLWRWRLREGLEKLRGNSRNQAIPTALVTEQIVQPGEDAAEDLSDHARACRQLMRWLVGEVPRRLDVRVREESSMGTGVVRITAQVRGRDFESREDADVRYVVTDPDGRVIELAGELSESQSGVFEAIVTAASPGPWKVRTTAVMTDEPEAEPLVADTGWACQPDQDEMKSVTINKSFLQQVADVSGGQLIPDGELDAFVDRLPDSDAPLVEITSWPIWHHWLIFASAVCCFIGDWTLRRRRGLP